MMETMMKADLDRFVTVAEAAQVVECKPWQLVELVERGEVKAVMHDGRMLVRVYDLDVLFGGQAASATASETPALCPAWCVDHTAGHTAGDERRPIIEHEGPEFGRFLTGRTTYLDTGEVGPLEVLGSDIDDVVQSPESLRRLAADALAAAEWLEGQR